MSQEKNTMFMRLHPFVNLIYFIIMMIFTMCYLHPVLLGITSMACFLYSCYLGGKKQFKWNIALIPMLFLLSFVNPLFNHSGQTVLFYLKGKTITLEAVLYGFVASLMIYNMILLFGIFHKVMTSDKIICICSKLLPVGALLFTMTLRFVPMYKAQLTKMRTALKGIGRDPSQGTMLERIQNGIALISGLMTWALENALENADSMKGRGFGLQGRTYYTTMKLTRLDYKVLFFEVVCLIGLLYGGFTGVFQISYYPVFSWQGIGGKEVVYYTIFFILAIFPMVLDEKEEVTWNYLRQKI